MILYKRHTLYTQHICNIIITQHKCIICLDYLKTPGGDTPPPPSVFGFGMCGRNYIKTYINNKKNNMKNISEKHTKHGPNIVKNRAPRLQTS